MPDRHIYVVDDDVAVLQTIERLLDYSGFVVTTSQDPAVFLSAAPGLTPGVVITDHVMGAITGLQIVEKLAAYPRQFQTILLTGFPEMKLGVNAMKAGATTAMEKPYDNRELLAAVEEAFELLSERRSGRRVQDVRRAEDRREQLLSRLSPREREVIVLVYNGLTNKEIARDLNISVKTVEKHRSSGQKKIGARNVQELIRMLDGLE